MTDLNFGPQTLINFAALDAELRAALPGRLDGISQDKHANLTVHVAAGEDAEALRPAIAGVIAAHNPNVLTPEQALRARRLAAMGGVGMEDFAALLGQINAASSMADAKPILRKLLALSYRMALAAGLTSAPEPGA